MSAQHPRLAPIRLKLERAKRFRDELVIKTKAFIDTVPYKMAARIDDHGRPVYFISQAASPPPELSLIAGDMFHNLRSALDHCVYQLYSMRRERSTDVPNNLGFPIFDSEQEYNAKHANKLRGLSGRAVAAVNALKPYKGGNDALWLLDQFNIIDKHRLLLTVAAGRIDVGVAPTIPLLERFDVSLFLRVADVVVRVGEEIFMDLPGAPVRNDLPFRIVLTINEPSVLPEPRPIEATVSELGRAAFAAMESLGPLLTEPRREQSA